MSNSQNDHLPARLQSFICFFKKTSTIYVFNLNFGFISSIFFISTYVSLCFIINESLTGLSWFQICETACFVITELSPNVQVMCLLE